MLLHPVKKSPFTRWLLLFLALLPLFWAPASKPVEVNDSGVQSSQHEDVPVALTIPGFVLQIPNSPSFFQSENAPVLRDVFPVFSRTYRGPPPRY